MKSKLALINVSLVIYFAGLLSAIGNGIKTGTILIIIAAAIIGFLYCFQLVSSFKAKKLISIEMLVCTIGVLILAEIFIQGFSVAIDMSLYGVPGFFRFHAFFGLMLLCLFLWSNIVWSSGIVLKKSRFLFLPGIAIFAVLNFIGLLDFAGVIHVATRLLYISFVFLTFFYMLFFLLLVFSADQQNRFENRIGLLLSTLMVIFWFLKWQTPDLISPGIYRIVFNTGFAIVIVLPFAIAFVKKYHFVTSFILYIVLLDFYFIGFNNNFKYLVNVGMNECVGYNNATEYAVINDPGISNIELFTPPTDDELKRIVNEWQRKDFAPKQVVIEREDRKANGDSLKVILHYVNGKKHYGAVRIPAGIDTKEAPILLGLSGGGADIDVVDPTFMNRMSSGICREVLNHYITVAPSFRGDIVRGDDFCFRSEGYTGDVWLGPAEDAIAFLEVVKAMYPNNDNRKVLAMGVSRGATVGLIIGALTGKLDYIIAISTHTNFHDINVYENELVGRDYGRVFFTPKTSPDIVRNKLITSSPYYFAERLPAFEIHQGTEDQQTTVYHANLLQQQLHELGRSDSAFRIHIYNGKGHGYDDDEIVCKSLNDFVTRK